MSSCSTDDTVRKLIEELTGCKPSEKDFDRYVKLVTSQLGQDHSSSFSPCAISDTLNTFAIKYDYLGFQAYSEFLKSAVGLLTNSDEDSNTQDENYRMLGFLLRLSNDDTFKPQMLQTLEPRLAAARAAVYPTEITEEEKLDWYHYLREGWEKFELPADEEESEDESVLDELMNQASTSEHKVSIKAEIDLETPSHEDAIICQVDSRMFSKTTNAKDDQKRIQTDGIESMIYLTNSVQNSWWNVDASNAVSSSVYQSANFGQNWEKTKNDLLIANGLQATEFFYLHEYKIIRELLMILVTDQNCIGKRMEALRQRISIPSLIQDTFKSYVYDVMDVAEKRQSLESWYNGMLNNAKAPFTFHAYALALKDICTRFYKKIMEEEIAVRKQDSTYTLLTLNNRLEPYFRLMKFLFELHNKCVDVNTNEVSRFHCVRLLSMLFDQYQRTFSQEYRKIILNLFFHTFEPYANVIDVWFAEGKLIDWKNEFFIKKLVAEQYVVFPFDNEMDHTTWMVAPFFAAMANKLLNCGQCFEFLGRLDRMSKLRKEILAEGKLIDCLKNRFSKQSHKNHSLLQTTINDVREINNDVDNGNEYVHYTNFESMRYLIKAFRFGDQSFSLGDFKISEYAPKDVDFETVPSGLVLEKVLYSLIHKREAIVIGTLRSSIVNEFQFSKHIQNLYALLNSDWNLYCDHFTSILESQSWTNHSLIVSFLCDYVENAKLPFGDAFRFIIEAKDNMGNFEATISKIMKAIDCVSLRYEVQWPMNLIFTPDLIINFYQLALKMILKINLAFSCISRLHFNDLPRVKLFATQLRRIQLFRYWVVLLLQKLRAYFSLSVAQHLDCSIIEKNLEINTVSGLQKDYARYLDSMMENFFMKTQMSEYMNRALHRIWLVCDDVIDLWTKASKLQLNNKDISQSLELYIQCVWYLTKILQKFVEGDQNPLYDLWHDLTSFTEVFKQNLPEDLSFGQRSLIQS